MAWILRFLNNAHRREEFVCELTATELTVARKVLGTGGSFQSRTAIAPEELTSAKRVKMAYFNPFLEDGLVQFGCRLH